MSPQPVRHNMSLLGRLALVLMFIFLPRTSEGSSHGEQEALHVTHPLFHSDLEKVEMCLEFNAELAPLSQNRDHLEITLLTNKKIIPLSPNSISISATFLCLTNLDYQTTYQVTLNGLSGLKQEKLEEPYQLSFTTPNRHPNLTLTNETFGSDIDHWTDANTSLQSINIKKADIELSHITNNLAEAWFKRHMTNLAPSEIIYFAHDNGTAVFHSTIDFEPIANIILEKPIPLHAINPAPAPGLYLLHASAPSVHLEPSEAGLSPQSAKWLLRSDLKLRAYTFDKGMYFITAHQKNDAPFPFTKVTLYDRHHHQSQTGQTNKDGALLLPLTHDQIDQLSLVIGETTSGDLDFYDPSHSRSELPHLPAVESILKMDKTIYYPNETITISLKRHGLHTVTQSLHDSAFQIVAADHTPIFHKLLPLVGQNLQSTLEAPSHEGTFRLEWLDGKGTLLTAEDFTVTAVMDNPHLSLQADRGRLSSDGVLGITVKTTDDSGKPSPFIGGTITASWSNLETIFSEWDGYHFGFHDRAFPTPEFITKFLTDSDGLTHLALTLTPPSELTPPAALVLHVSTSASHGLPSDGSLSIPLIPKNDLIGLKPFDPDGHFSENSLAKFSVIALDTTGHRRALNNLSYHVYEEGRNFDWFQSSGQWDYKPLAYDRRLGGGALTLSNNSDTIIEWPVTSGNYRIDILDAQGNLLSRYRFSAGWFITEDVSLPSQDFKATLTTPFSPTHHKIVITYKVDKPSLLVTSVADDEVRLITHRLSHAGTNQLVLSPENDWGNSLLIHLLDVTSNRETRLVVEHSTTAGPVITSQGHDPEKTLEVKPMERPGELRIHDTFMLPLSYSTESLKPHDTAKLTFESQDGLSLISPDNPLTLVTGTHGSIELQLTADKPGFGTLGVLLTGQGLPETKIPFKFPIFDQPSPLKLISTHELAEKKNLSYPTDFHETVVSSHQTLILAPYPLPDLPAFLGRLLEAHPLSTQDLADTYLALTEWGPMISQIGLAGQEQVEVTEHNLRTALLSHQDINGSFRDLQEQVDPILSTAKVVLAFKDDSDPQAIESRERAVDWLKGVLSNTWFEERDRSVRAYALEALAVTHKLDTATLHFFSDTSMEHHLTALASAQIALAFAEAHDTVLAQQWLAKLPTPDLSQLDCEVSRTRNSLITTPERENFLVNIMAKTDVQKLAYRDLLNVLHILAAELDHVSPYKISDNGQTKSYHGVFALPHLESIHILTNLSTHNLWAYLSEEESRPSRESLAMKSSYHLFNQDGSTRDPHQPLHLHNLYFILVEGALPKLDRDEKFGLDLHIPAGLRSLGCGVDPASIHDQSLYWIKDLNLNDPLFCQMDKNGPTALLRAHGPHDGWRFGMIVRAEVKGHFYSAPSHISTKNGYFATDPLIQLTVK